VQTAPALRTIFHHCVFTRCVACLVCLQALPYNQVQQLQRYVSAQAATLAAQAPPQHGGTYSSNRVPHQPTLQLHAAPEKQQAGAFSR
jgi:hypothetical protein